MLDIRIMVYLLTTRILSLPCFSIILSQLVRLSSDRRSLSID
jgi:hypothetical protein